MNTNFFPPVVTSTVLGGVFGAYESIARASADYVAGAMARRATPFELTADMIDWVGVMTRRERPQWASPHRILCEWPIARLRDFSTVPPSGTPTVFLPPQAGHDSCIVDYDPRQSQVRTALDAGLTAVYALDWIGATQATKNSSIDDYVEVIRAAVDRIGGGPVNLVGDCQGGWLGTIYTALHPDTVASLTVAGAPIDFHAGEPQIYDWMEVLAPDRNLDFYRNAVRANGGVLPGEFLLGGFIALQPANELDKRLQLLAHIHESAHVTRYRTFENWFQHTQPIAGAFYLWIIEHLFQNNELITGDLRVGDRRVDLGAIDCPVHLLAGAADHITPPPQVYALADYVSTDPATISRRLADGGHLGLFMGQQSLATQWAPLFRALSET